MSHLDSAMHLLHSSFCGSGPGWFAVVTLPGVYLDDIIILGSSFDDHLQNLQLVFERVQEAGLKLQPKKCAFLQTSVAYLGHILSKEGVSTNPAKVEKVATWPMPTNRKEVQRFLGYY